MLEQAKAVLRIESEAITRMAKRLDDRFEKAVRLILECRGRTVVTGMGKSGIIGKKISSTLASTGTPSLFLHPAEGSHGDLGMVARGDVAVALSNSGETEEIIRLLTVLRRMDIRIVALVGTPDYTLARRTDLALDVSVPEEACPLGLAPTASTTAALAMGDALAMVVLQHRNFRREDFAMFHPGGALGKKLILTVGDLMHDRESVPRIGPRTLVRDALFVVSSGRLGMATVVDAEDRLLGIITDGDIRRGLEREQADFLLRTAEEVMTRSPKTTVADALAAEALALMEKHAITSIVVLADESRIHGVIHLHDLLKAGLV